DRQGQNFIGVKIGDVNGNAIANSLIAETRSVSTLQLEMPSIQVNAGDEVIVPLTVTQVMEVVGLQMAFETNGLAITEVVGPAEIGTADFNTTGNTTKVVWYDNAGARVSSGDELLYMTVKAQQTGHVSEMIQLSTNQRDNLAFDAELEQFDLRVASDRAEQYVAQTLEVWQNTPNPFSDVTTIQFATPINDAITLTVSDISGQVVHRVDDTYDAGTHQIEIAREVLPANGLYYYEIRTSKSSVTRKMIVIE
ncbi:MAG: T9SS type A sorting domain-containing protein, partial [Bacteroidota bacterium]